MAKGRKPKKEYINDTRQAGGDSLRATAARLPLFALHSFSEGGRAVQPARASGVLRQPAADGGNVRRESRRGTGTLGRTRTGDKALGPLLFRQI